MKIVVQIFLCSVLGGLAIKNMDMVCEDDASNTLSNCQSNPNIRIEKVHKMGDIKSYKLSLYYQNTWWPTAKNDKWIECKDLCDVCRSLPGVEDVDVGKNIKLWL